MIVDSMVSREYDSNMNKKKKPKKVLAVLLSCCICLSIICACLIAALVLIGKHIMYNTQRSSTGRSHHPIHYPTRLPRDTLPILYDITLLPDLDEGSYKGFLNLTLEVASNRSDIRIHSHNLTVSSVELQMDNSSHQLKIQNVEELPADEMLVIHTKERISPGIYHLSIRFSGSLQDKLLGFYRSYYRDAKNGSIRQMATSKFEPTYARQAFPCFDEPNMKAKFKVHLLKPKDPSYRALSNYPQTGEEEVEKGVLVHFEETVPMSTYLSCFIVSDFTFTERQFTSEDQVIPFRVYASPGQLEKTQYAGKVGKDAIEFYINYFNIPYPLPKLDMVAIPDFVSGAMEHWGLVTYRETALLYTQKTHSSTNKQRVATVVAHELAHSWFGNLVTMDWWDNLWLNEGFATYIQYKGVDASEPDWQMLDQFLVADLHPVLDLDGTVASHPIIKNVTTPDQITEVFDTISYSKGASILRMLENAVGGEAFRAGVTNYLNKYKYSNAVTQNLWDELQSVVGDSFNITHFMDTFIVQMGYPLLEATFEKENNLIRMTQRWFLTNQDTAPKAPPSPYGYKWTVPIRYITNLNPSESQIVWFSQDEDEVIIELGSEIEWIKFNPRQVGYYRVNYDNEHWYKLIRNVGELSVADRTHLLEEMYGLAEAGVISYNMTLDLTKYLRNEFDYLPWTVASTKLQEIYTHLIGSAKEWDFKKYVKTIVQPALNKLSWNEDENDSHLTRLARVRVLTLACSIGHEQCLAEAKEKFEDWLVNKTHLSPDLRGIIYEYGMETIDEGGWNKVLEIFSNESDANEKLKLLNGLANVRDPALLSKLINLAKNESLVRKQDYFTCLKYIAGNPLGTPVVWDYVRDEWENLVDRFTLNDRYLGRLIPAVTETFSTQTKLEEMQAFFNKYPDSGAGDAARQQALDNVKNNIKWLSKYKVVVENWLSNNNL